jgi:hypothetical protein
MIERPDLMGVCRCLARKMKETEVLSDQKQ